MIGDKFSSIMEKIKQYYPNKWTLKKKVIVITLIIISISFVLFFYFQHQSEFRIRDIIFEQQRKESNR